MNDGSSSAIQRTSEDVWWMILDQLIDEPLLFATTYEGNDWSNDASKSKKRLYERCEEQRKIVGSVCRLWHIFARLRRHRMVVIKDANELVMDTTSKARYAFLCKPSAIDSRYAQGASVEWETLKLQDAKMLPQVASTLSCPRIRRLDLPFLDEVPNGVPQFSDILSIFSEITWLDCTIKSWRMSSITATNRPPAILPKLEAFRCECQYSDAPTLSKFVLPSLRYLYIHFYASLREIPLFDILLSFRHSIQSVVVMIDRDKSGKQGMPFPQWSNFPELKELKLSQRWSLDFPPLPFDHPLQKLDALHKTFDAIPSLLEGTNMRHITLRKTRWRASGELKGNYYQEMDPIKATELWEYAKAKGIRFEVAYKGKLFHDRDEAIAAAQPVYQRPEDDEDYEGDV